MSRAHEPARRKIAHLTLIAQDPVSGERSKTGRVEGGVVNALNKAVRARRRRQKPENLERLVAPVAGMLVQQIGEWLRGEPAPRDVFIVGHLAGGEVTFQFILYHCRRRGKVNVRAPPATVCTPSNCPPLRGGVAYNTSPASLYRCTPA